MSAGCSDGSKDTATHINSKSTASSSKAPTGEKPSTSTTSPSLTPTTCKTTVSTPHGRVDTGCNGSGAGGDACTTIQGPGGTITSACPGGTTGATGTTTTTGSATGAPQIIDRSNETFTLDCGAGQSYAIEGNDSTITSTGACAMVEITGNGHRVDLSSVQTLDVSGNDNRAKASQVGTIDVSGNDNAVTYVSGPGGTEPQISKSGTNNTVSK